MIRKYKIYGISIYYNVILIVQTTNLFIPLLFMMMSHYKYKSD